MAPQRESYMAIVGGLLWLANMTRFDIAYASSQLARFISNPGPAQMRAAVRVLIYLRDSADRDLVYSPDPTRPLVAFVDSSWLSGFSCSGAFLFFFGCPFHWFAKTQRSMTLSSAEAEFFGAMIAAKDVIFSRDLLIDLGIVIDLATEILSDSKSAVDMAFDPVAFKKTKHILRAAEFLRDLVARQVVTLRHVKGVIMLADILTKGTARAIFLDLLSLLDSYSTSGEESLSSGSD